MRPPDHSQFENHRLTFFVLILITEGTGKHSINFKDYQFEKGTAFALRPGSIHKFYDSNAKGYLLVFKEDFAFQYFGEENAIRIFQLFNEQLASPKQQLNNLNFNQILAYIISIKKEFNNIRDEFSPEVIRSLLHIIITELLRVKTADNAVFAQTKYLSLFLRFQKLVEKHYEEFRKVGYFADQLSITPRTLNNITQSVVQKSAKVVIDDILISKIKSLLINSQLTISQIAYKMGFYEASHLSKFFKQHTGFSPKKFREMFK